MFPVLQILCIHLKRFRHELMFSIKISTHVSFPLEGLDLQPFLAKDSSCQTTNYDLLSVICHHGTASSEWARSVLSWHTPGVLRLFAAGSVCHVRYFLGFCSSKGVFLSLFLGGHYIAYCRNNGNNLWYEFDDHRVTEVSESCVQNAEAYVLFYKYDASFYSQSPCCNEICESSRCAWR